MKLALICVFGQCKKYDWTRQTMTESLFLRSCDYATGEIPSPLTSVQIGSAPLDHCKARKLKRNFAVRALGLWTAKAGSNKHVADQNLDRKHSHWWNSHDCHMGLQFATKKIMWCDDAFENSKEWQAYGGQLENSQQIWTRAPYAPCHSKVGQQTTHCLIFFWLA